MPQTMPLTGLRPAPHGMHLAGAQYAVVVGVDPPDLGLQGLVAHRPGAEGTGLGCVVGARGDLDIGAGQHLAEPAQAPQLLLAGVDVLTDQRDGRPGSAAK